MKTYKYLLLFLFITFVVLLAGCSVLANQLNRATQTVEATPTLVALPTQLSFQSQVESQSCQVAELISIQTDKPQGDLMAWSPTGHRLAFVEPVNQYSGFYIGEISVIDAAQKDSIFTSKDHAVFGDLTWSPDGSTLAFAALDQTAGIYTVKTATLSDGQEIDIFGDAARTEEYASQKGILSWATASELMVTSVCGSDCVRLYQFNPISQSLTELQEIRYNENTSLTLVDELSSPDGKWRIDFDNKNNTWLTLIAENRISLLMPATKLQETKFSKDSQYLAIRTADKVLIYQLGCSAE